MHYLAFMPVVFLTCSTYLLVQVLLTSILALATSGELSLNTASTASAPLGSILPVSEYFGIVFFNAARYSSLFLPTISSGIFAMISSGECEWIQARVASIAVVSACVSFSWPLIQATVEYSAPPGYSPPNVSSVSFWVRVSLRMRRSLWLPWSTVTEGSSITAASIWPCSIAATAVAPRPTPITAVPAGSSPFFLSKYLRKKSVEEPGALTPTFLPARSLIDLISPLCEGDTTSTRPG